VEVLRFQSNVPKAGKPRLAELHLINLLAESFDRVSAV
jgi:hypothetical protein